LPLVRAGLLPVCRPLLQKNSSFKAEKKIDSTFADLYIAALNF